MTADQIREIIGADNMAANNSEPRLYVPNIAFISFGKDKNLTFSEQKRVRFLFDEEFEVLEITICRPYSIAGNLPPHGNYDILDDYKGVSTVYEYLVDDSGTLIVDYYGFEAISLISLREV